MQETLGIFLAEPFVGVVICDGDRIVAAVAFNNFDRQSIDLSITSFGPLQVKPIREIFRYLFNRLGVKRVTCATLPTNHRAIKSLFHFGFEYEGTQRQRFPQGDALMFGLLASEQKIVRLT